MRRASKFSFLALAFALTLAFAHRVNADVRVPSIIGDNMVLQQGRKDRVWGWAQAGERVTVTFQGRAARATADAGGRWQVLIGPFKAGGPYTLTVAGANTLTFKNVLVGDVWVCSGQSNMEWILQNAQGGPQDAAQADYPEIHLFTVTKKTSDKPLEDVEGHWVVTTPKEAAQFSAVGYFFGRELHQRLKVPVGLKPPPRGRPPRRSRDEPRRVGGRPDAQADTRTLRQATDRP